MKIKYLPAALHCYNFDGKLRVVSFLPKKFIIYISDMVSGMLSEESLQKYIHACTIVGIRAKILTCCSIFDTIYILENWKFLVVMKSSVY